PHQIRAEQAATQWRGDHVRNFLHARMQEFFNLQELRLLDARALIYPVETRQQSFKSRHSRRVFVGHPESQIARRLAEQRKIATTEFCVQISNRLKPLEILGSVCDVLIIREALDACQ